MPTSYTRPGQSERHIPPAPIRAPEILSRVSDQGQIHRRFTFKHTRITQNHALGRTLLNTSFLLPNLPLANVPAYIGNEGES